MTLAEALANYLQELSDDEDGITTDHIINHLDEHYKEQIFSHKFTHTAQEWTAILVFVDKSAVKIHSLEGQFDVYVGTYTPTKAH